MIDGNTAVLYIIVILLVWSTPAIDYELLSYHPGHLLLMKTYVKYMLLY